jgi:uncharacterized GH25 family protein
MTRKILTHTALTLALGLLPAAAHDFVLTSGTDADKQTTISGLYGHPGSWETPDIHRLFALDVHTSAKDEPESLLEKVTVAKSSVLKLQATVSEMEESDYLAVSAIYDNGFWVSAKGGKYFNTTKKEAAGRISVEEGSHNIKFAKVLISGKDKATGHRLEIVLQKTPTDLAAGAKVPVMVVFDGKALESAELAIVPLDGVLDHDTPGIKTDAMGMAELPLGKTGTHVIRVSHDVPSKDPDLADIDSFSATLVFDAG